MSTAGEARIAPVHRWIRGMHVELSGEGRTVLLLHGNAGTTRFFDTVAPVLADTFRVAAVDSRGQGRTPRGDGPLTIGRMAEDAADVARALAGPGRTVDVVGFSDGANAAMLLAARHPDLVGRVVLASGNLRPEGLRPLVLAGLRAVGVVLRMLPAIPAVVRRRELIGLMTRGPHIGDADLAGIACPALVIAGSRDVIRPAHTARIAHAIPGARLATLPGGHPLLRRDPRAARVVLGFLRGDATGV